MITQNFEDSGKENFTKSRDIYVSELVRIRLKCWSRKYRITRKNMKHGRYKILLVYTFFLGYPIFCCSATTITDYNHYRYTTR